MVAKRVDAGAVATCLASIASYGILPRCLGHKSLCRRGGHYISAHVRVSPCSSDGVEEASVAFEESERWLHVDDDLVEAAKPEDVVTDGAYVLFYRRRRLSGRLVVGHTAVAPVV